MKKWLESWHLKNIILITLIGAVCGVIFWILGPLYNLLTVALTPMGLAPYANAILIGGWTMAGPLAALIIRIPGSALLGEFLGAFVEMILGGQWGADTLISGLVQGIGSELGFTLTGYKMYNWISVSLSCVTTTIVTFGWEMIKGSYDNLHFGMIVGLFIVSLISVFVLSGLLPMLIAKLLEKSHMINA